MSEKWIVPESLLRVIYPDWNDDEIAALSIEPEHFVHDKMLQRLYATDLILLPGHVAVSKEDGVEVEVLADVRTLRCHFGWEMNSSAKRHLVDYGNLKNHLAKIGPGRYTMHLVPVETDAKDGAE